MIFSKCGPGAIVRRILNVGIHFSVLFGVARQAIIFYFFIFYLA
jgi:hypothetical protein